VSDLHQEIDSFGATVSRSCPASAPFLSSSLEFFDLLGDQTRVFDLPYNNTHQVSARACINWRVTGFRDFPRIQELSILPFSRHHSFETTPSRTQNFLRTLDNSVCAAEITLIIAPSSFGERTQGRWRKPRPLLFF
jgi:hypothetical protein